MAKGDRVEILVDAGGGTAKEYEVVASRAGRKVEVKAGRTTVEVQELTRTNRVVRSARFMAPRVLAVVEHPVDELNGRTESMPAVSGRRRPGTPIVPPLAAADRMTHDTGAAS